MLSGFGGVLRRGGRRDEVAMKSRGIFGCGADSASSNDIYDCCPVNFDFFASISIQFR